ncbi:MAG: oligopeptide/dipeptide ABC transporter ATP-binding protein [Halapricum sp.]
MSEREPLLTVDDLAVHYPITKGLLRREVGRVRAVDGVSFTLERGETLGLVGESGCGKTTLAHAVLDLETPTGGEVRFDGDPISDRTGADRREFRRRAQLIVQDPNEAFNPRMTVGEAVAEPLAIHGMDDAERRREIVRDLLERVGLHASDAEQYPHEFSGGEKQRLAIARALVLDPDLLVADEPTSALDGRVQADILELLAAIRREFAVSILFVSHDLDVVRRFCDRVAVMYLGEIVEQGPIATVFESPAHPYTRVLRGSVPSLEPGDDNFVQPLTDSVPDPADPPDGCRFHTRCPELIAPADVDLPPEQFRAVAAFRFTLATGELPDGIAVTDAPEPETIRQEFGLPAQLADETVDSGVDTAIDALSRGDRDVALDRMRESLPTVCEREQPGESTVDGRMVRCHRYDPEQPGQPRSWNPNGRGPPK